MLGITIVVIGGVLLMVVTLASAIEIVGEGELEALHVSGEMRAVLDSGLHFVPPFVSTTYPIDPETNSIEKGSRRVTVPEEFHEDVRSAAS